MRTRAAVRVEHTVKLLLLLLPTWCLLLTVPFRRPTPCTVWAHLQWTNLQWDPLKNGTALHFNVVQGSKYGLGRPLRPPVSQREHTTGALGLRGFMSTNQLMGTISPQPSTSTR